MYLVDLKELLPLLSLFVFCENLFSIINKAPLSILCLLSVERCSETEGLPPWKENVFVVVVHHGI